MRTPAALAVVVLGGLASAEPPRRARIEGEAAAPSGNANGSGSAALGVTGVPATGTVIAPPAHPDARPWPRGMVMAPPDPNDPMALAPGTRELQLAERRDRGGWSRRLADALQDRVGLLVELMLLPQAL